MSSRPDSLGNDQLTLERRNLNSTVNVLNPDGIRSVSPQVDQDDIVRLPTVSVRNSSISTSSEPALLSRTVFPRMLIFTLIRLVIYLNKLYQDFDATFQYKDHRDYNFFLISLVSIIAPPIIYALYRIGLHSFARENVGKKEVSTQAVNGILLIPWQIKRHLDVLYLAAQRACYCKAPNEEEQQNLKQLQLSAEVLEFFEDFYAGFLQILLQIYVFFGTVDWIDSHKLKIKPLVGELVGSSLCVVSMMIAVRRRDDGLFTRFLSFFGWLSFISARVLVFALVTTVIHSWIAVLCLAHALIFTRWIYRIAIESHNTTASNPANNSNVDQPSPASLSFRKRASTAILSFFFFGVPSLFIWPIMFQLKEKKRPLIFLLVNTIENLVLLGIWLIWIMHNQDSRLSESLVIFIVGIVIATLLGDFMLLLYIQCKPKYTDLVAYHHIKQLRETPESLASAPLNGVPMNRTSDALKYGVFYVFSEVVFKLPSTDKVETGLQRLRQMQLVEL